MKKLLPILLFALPAAVAAQSTGFLPPSSTPAPNGGWNNPSAAFVSDDVYTDVPHQSGCRCPFLYLSWDNGVTYSSLNLVGPFGTTDNTMTAGSPTDTWGHAWTDTEFSNANFRLKIANPSTLIEQGYGDFNFTIPAGATITGIEVRVEEHGDSAYTTEYIDLIEVNVHYTLSTGISANAFNSGVSMYPNPATSQLNVTGIAAGTKRIALMDMAGRTVMETMNITSDQFVFDVAHLPRGMYMLLISDQQNGTLTRKVVIE
jgi:hypothetical protein